MVYKLFSNGGPGRSRTGARGVAVPCLSLLATGPCIYILKYVLLTVKLYII